MTSAFLKMFGTPSMSKNLRELLNYFGNFFEPSLTVIESNLDLQSVQQPLCEPMTVVDPLNEHNNVTRSAFNIKQIQAIFKAAFTTLITQEAAFKASCALKPSLQ
jgi:DNA polymerase sigma